MAQWQTWNSVRPQIESCASSRCLIPFLGAAISHFRPTSLPLGKGLLHAALQGVFPDRMLFESSQEQRSVVEEAFDSHSAEVILQGLAEGLLDRSRLVSLYNMMAEVPPNSLHHLVAEALVRQKVPAVFTTNQDRCLEDASPGIHPIYDEDGFACGLGASLFQFHGATGGSSPGDVADRKRSLTVTLNSMGPRLPSGKHQVLGDALGRYALLFLGYSGSDPDVWYSLDELFDRLPQTSVFWCVRAKPSGHLKRLQDRHPDSVVVFTGDIGTILSDLAVAWRLPKPEAVRMPNQEEELIRVRKLRSWAQDLPWNERRLAFGWLLVSVGLYRQGAEELETLAAEVSAQPVHMCALLFAGYARRELSDHFIARQHLKRALGESRTIDRCRYAQAAHKLGESYAAFESVRFWYFWPDHPIVHSGAKWLNMAIKGYEQLAPEERAEKRFRAAGLGNAKMNLAQLYRRTAAYTPRLRPRLAQKASGLSEEHIRILKEDERDLRSLPMARAHFAVADPERSSAEKLAEVDRAIEYSECWNQDDIQIGSAYFAKGYVLGPSTPSESELHYLRALSVFRKAGMKAEIARTELELASVLCRQARRTAAEAQASWEWRLGTRLLTVVKIVRALALKEVLAFLLLLSVSLYFLFRSH